MLFPVFYFRKRELEGLGGEGAETVEPILDSFGGYSTDNLSNFYYPYIIVLLMVFRDEVSHTRLNCPTKGGRKRLSTNHGLNSRFCKDIGDTSKCA